MQPEQPAPRDGPQASRRAVDARLETDRLRAACTQQAEMLSRLRVAIAGLYAGAPDSSPAAGNGGTWIRKASLPLDGSAPGTGRRLAEDLDGLVPESVVQNVQLVVSELVTNSVRHSGAPAHAQVQLSIGLTDTMVRVEVTDPGYDGVVTPRAQDLQRGGGFGLGIVRATTERWGLEQSAADGTRVWADLRATERPGLAAV